MAEPLRIVTADGTLGTVDPGELDQALAAGAKVATPEDVQRDAQTRDYGGLGGELAAAGLGAARGLTLGLSDPLAVAVGGESARKALEGYQAENPIASGAGELVGAVAPIVASGGTSLGARTVAGVGFAPRLAAGAGRLAERGVLGALGEGTNVAGRVGRAVLGQAAAGAAEASLYGAGQAISEAAIGDHELTAEHVLAHMGESAAFGGLLGGGTALPFALAGEAATAVAGAAKRGATRLGELAKATGPRVLDAVDSANAALGRARDQVPGYLQKLDQHAADILPSSEELIRMRNENAWRSTYARKKFTEEANARFPGGADGVGAVLHETGVLKSEDGVLKSALSPEELLGRIEPAREGVGQKLGAIAEQSNATVKIGTALQAIEEVIQPLREIAGRESVVSSLESYRDSFLRHLGAFSDEGRILIGKKIPVQQIRAQRIGLQDIAYAEAKSLDPNARVEFLRKIRGALDDLEVGALVEGGADAAQIATLKRQYQGLRIAEDATADSISRLGANRSVGATDYLAFIGGGGGVSGATLALMNKVARERGSAGLSAMLDDLAKTRSVLTTAKKLGLEATEGVRDVAAKYRLQERSMAALGAITRASEGITRDIDAGVRSFVDAANKSAKEATVRGKSAAASAGKAVAKAREVRSALYSDAFAQATNDRRREAARRREVEALARSYINLGQNPAALQARVERALGSVPTYAPQIAEAMTAKLVNAAAFLAEKAPRGRTNPNSLTPHLERPRYSDEDIVRFERYLRAIEQPTSIVHDLAKGRVTREAVQAVKAVYPKTYEQIRTRIIMGSARLEATLPIEKAAPLGVLFDAPTHWSLEPSALAMLQANFAQNGAEAETAVNPANVENGPARPLQGQVATRMMTNTERLEGA